MAYFIYLVAINYFLSFIFL